MIHRKARSFERKVAFRVKPPGQPGRPRRHYPPIWGCCVYEAKLVETVRAKLHDSASGRGEYVVVREAGGFRIWSNDEHRSECIPVRRDAIREARKQARSYDFHERRALRAAAIDANIDTLQNEIDRLNALENDEKVALGRRMPWPHGARWRAFTNILVLHPGDPLCRVDGREKVALRDDVRTWCQDNKVPVLTHLMRFANAFAGPYKVPVYCLALSFEDPLHAVAFKLVWWGDVPA